MNIRFQLLFVHILTLLLGGLIYVSFRSDQLLMFKWFKFINIDEIIFEFRPITLKFIPNLPNWFLYSLPDGLFLFSYVSLMLAIWNIEFHAQSIFWILSIPALIILSEIGQKLLIVPGTFDLMDLLFYLFGVLIPVVLFRYIKMRNLKLTV